MEFRDSSGGSKKKTMQYSDFQRLLEAGNDDLYMTTQTVRRHAPARSSWWHVLS